MTLLQEYGGYFPSVEIAIYNMICHINHDDNNSNMSLIMKIATILNESTVYVYIIGTTFIK